MQLGKNDDVLFEQALNQFYRANEMLSRFHVKYLERKNIWSLIRAFRKLLRAQESGDKGYCPTNGGD